MLDARASGERRSAVGTRSQRRMAATRLGEPRRRRGLSARLPRGRAARRRGRAPQPRVQRAEPSRVSRRRQRLRPQRRLARPLSRRVSPRLHRGLSRRLPRRSLGSQRPLRATARGTAAAIATRARRAASATATARASRTGATTTGSSRSDSRKCGRARRRATTTTSARASATRPATATASASATRTASAAPTRGGSTATSELTSDQPGIPAAGRRTAGRPIRVGRPAALLCAGVSSTLLRFFLDLPVSSRGQDTWFSATGPGFESPYRYHPSLACISERATDRKPSELTQEDRGDQT